MPWISSLPMETVRLWLALRRTGLVQAYFGTVGPNLFGLSNNLRRVVAE